MRVDRKTLAVTAFCVLSTSLCHADDWWQWRGPDRDGVCRESGLITVFPPGKLKPRWKVPVGTGFSTPVVAHGRVYVSDAELILPTGRERILAFDERTGQRQWVYTYDPDYPKWALDGTNPLGPRATPIVENGRIYSLGILGRLVALDAKTGSVLWKHDLQKEFSGHLECTGSPLLENDLLIVSVGARPDACVIAFDKQSGKKVWSALNEAASFSSPMIATVGDSRQLIIWTQQWITALHPATGKVYWRQRLNTSGDFAVPTPVQQGDKLFVGGLMLKLDQEGGKPAILWPSAEAVTAKLLSNTSTPVLDGDYVYTAKSSGEFVCLEAATGKEVWKTDKVTGLRRGASAQITPNGDSAFVYNDRGELIRARLVASGYQELSRTALIEPTFPFFGAKYAWAPPAFANEHLFVRNDRELLCVSLAATR
ncbi:MAG TPA: PQQ-binding-like beta-propeller repeat protein [Planctomycetaceae bacterium]|jgi:outer membrane protein assembly factor BamB|nr:PQQ-binding-like beta-propeller repeat protein [Planctomycetaceae bacterium]